VGRLLLVLVTGASLLVASWLMLIVLARRLPPGAARDLASVLPACVTTVRRLRRDDRVPPRARLAVAVALAWVLSPIDLIPEFLPVIGPLDDVVVVALALRYAGRQVPREVLVEAWPAEIRILDRLLGKRSLSPNPRRVHPIHYHGNVCQCAAASPSCSSWRLPRRATRRLRLGHPDPVHRRARSAWSPTVISPEGNGSRLVFTQTTPAESWAEPAFASTVGKRDSGLSLCG